MCLKKKKVCFFFFTSILPFQNPVRKILEGTKPPLKYTGIYTTIDLFEIIFFPFLHDSEPQHKGLVLLFHLSNMILTWHQKRCKWCHIKQCFILLNNWKKMPCSSFLIPKVTFFFTWPFIIDLCNTDVMPTMKGDIPQATEECLK